MTKTERYAVTEQRVETQAATRPARSLLTAILCAAILCGALAVCVLALSGCQRSTDLSVAGRVVEDAYGRNVAVPAEVESVAVVGSAARVVVYAGGQDRLVAVTAMDQKNSPLMPYTQVWADTFASLPVTCAGYHLNEDTVDAEALMALEPDVVISSRSAAECDALQEATGIPVVGAGFQNEIFSDEVYDAIIVVGEVLGTLDHAEDVVAALKAWEADLDARTADIADDDRPTAYVGAVNYKGAKGFGGTYGGYAPFAAVHARNVADEAGVTGSFEVDLERIGSWDADIMFVNMANESLLREEYAEHADFFNQLSAFASGSIYTQPSFNYNGTNVELGVCDAYFCGSVLYPERFADLDLEEVYDEVFETLIGSPYYDTLKASGTDFCQVELWN